MLFLIRAYGILDSILGGYINFFSNGISWYLDEADGYFMLLLTITYVGRPLD